MSSPEPAVLLLHVERTSDPRVLRWIVTPPAMPPVPGVAAPGSRLGGLVAAGTLREASVRADGHGRLAVDVVLPQGATAAVAAEVDAAVRADVVTPGWCEPACPPERAAPLPSEAAICPVGCHGCPVARRPQDPTRGR